MRQALSAIAVMTAVLAGCNTRTRTGPGADNLQPDDSSHNIVHGRAVQAVIWGIVFITAHDDPDARAGAEAAGCVAYFRKTDSGAEVLEAIRRCVH